jgi:hypothetical protein
MLQLGSGSRVVSIILKKCFDVFLNFFSFLICRVLFFADKMFTECKGFAECKIVLRVRISLFT